MKTKKSPNALLSVHIAPQLIEAVLMTEAAGQVQVLRRFVRPRAQKDNLADAKSIAAALPGLKGRQDADYSLQVGGGGGLGSGEGFVMPAELKHGGLGVNGENGASAGAVAGDRPKPFSAQLLDILNECTAAGHPAPDLAFSIAPPDVSYVAFGAGGEGGDRAKDRDRATSRDEPADARTQRKKLLQRLGEVRESRFNAEQVAFIPVALGDRGSAGWLALVPEEREPVGPTLALVEDQRQEALSGRRVLDAELAVYARLARKAAPAGRLNYMSAVVRVDAEETLVLFHRGDRLRHHERLRSLSTYDSPDTICSRVLLQQDEQKLGEVHHVIVVAESHSDQLVEAFRSFYPDAVVESGGETLLGLGLQEPSESDVKFTPGSIPAVALGLRLLQDWDAELPELDVHLLPRSLRRKKRLAVGWHTGVAALLLFTLTFFFTWRYMEGQDEIQRQRQELEQNPVVLPVDDPEALKLRVDSVRTAYMTYSTALHVLDSLLVSSDKWSRTLEITSRATGEVGGIWFSDWSPQGNEMWVEGAALVRSRVAILARRLGGRIERLDFQDVNVPEVGERRIYPYTMVIPLLEETPRVAVHLQTIAEGLADPAGGAARLTTAADLYAPGEQFGDDYHD